MLPGDQFRRFRGLGHIRKAERPEGGNQVAGGGKLIQGDKRRGQTHGDLLLRQEKAADQSDPVANFFRLLGTDQDTVAIGNTPGLNYFRMAVGDLNRLHRTRTDTFVTIATTGLNGRDDPHYFSPSLSHCPASTRYWLIVARPYFPYFPGYTG